MLRRHVVQAIAIILIPGFLFSCAPTRIPPVSAAGAGYAPDRDEVELWERARVEEKKLDEKARVYEDPLLVDYLESVVGTLNPPGMAANTQIRYRVTVLEDPSLNAFSFPTGSLYVHTGLLARMENEAQLATVLGHEMTHVENRHMLRHERSARNRQLALMGVAVAGAVVAAGESGHAAGEGNYGKAARIDVLSDLMLGLGLQLAFVAAVNGYGRELEREADEGGFEKMSLAGFDPHEAPKVYKTLLEDHGDKGKVEAFFFGSHPRLEERVANAQAWIAAHPTASGDGAAEADGEAAKAEFTRRMRPVIRDDARLNIAAGRLELAEDQLKRAIELMPTDAEARFLQGKLKLTRAASEKDPQQRDALRAEAGAAFDEAIRLDPQRPEPYRERGLLAYRGADYATACAMFQKFIDIDWKAEEAQSIRDYLLELRRDGHCTDAAAAVAH